MANTLAVVTTSSLRVGHVTLASSWRTSRTNCAGDVLAMTLLILPWVRLREGVHLLERFTGFEARSGGGGPQPPDPVSWQEWRDSNPQPPVLETGALPVELHSYACTKRQRRSPPGAGRGAVDLLATRFPASLQGGRATR